MSQTQVDSPEELHMIATRSQDLAELIEVANNPNSDEKTLMALTVNAANFYADPKCTELLEALAKHPGHTPFSLWKMAAVHVPSVQGLGEIIENHKACTPEVKQFVGLMGKLNS